MKKVVTDIADRSRARRKTSPSVIDTAPAAASWPDRLHAVLRDMAIHQVAYVPDSGHARLIELVRSDRGMRAIPLTTEEEGVALAVGAWLGGDRSVLLTQSSGVGNCINMLSMVQECRVPLLMLVTMRGEWGEFNPWQLPMAQATKPVLTAMGVVVHRADDADQIVQTVSAAGRLAFNTSRAVAVLISQRVIGAKEFKK
ncbi:MAG TPA: thiamine pyrophosphate-binding protein [Burkholderiales bacterium]|jgi:sulfopyruvate decarboxylase alpha subunit|nr:thiamine pyrophosphate-binding protein [Burkholderiales bacterium]